MTAAIIMFLAIFVPMLVGYLAINRWLMARECRR